MKLQSVTGSCVRHATFNNRTITLHYITLQNLILILILVLILILFLTYISHYSTAFVLVYFYHFHT